MRIKLFITTFFLIWFTANPWAWGQEPPQITGETAVLMDVQTGALLFGKEEHKRMYPASTTKVMTALLALERSELSDEVTIGPNAVRAGGTAIWLLEGERLTMEELLYALLLNSANDAGVAIAEQIAGSVEKFAEISNQRARELGARDTNFRNPHGMPDENHYSTAYDLALIGRKAMQNKDFRKIVSTVNHEIPRTDPEAQKYLFNHNKLLWSKFYGYKGATGIKTGYTVQAGQCIIASAERDGRELIAVVLRSEGSNLWTDAAKLLDYGFANFENRKVIKGDKVLAQLPVKYGKGDIDLFAARDYFYTFPAGKKNNLEISVQPVKAVSAPVTRGQVLGAITLRQEGKLINKINLVAARDVPKDWFAWTKSQAYWILPLLFIVMWVRRRRRIIKMRKSRAARRKRYYTDLE